MNDNPNKMSLAPSLLLVISIGLLTRVFLGAVVLPTAMQPDSTYQTGIVTVISSTLGSSLTYTLNYNWGMSTSSLNASLGVVGMNLRTANAMHGFRMRVISLNQSALIMQVRVFNNNNPLSLLKVSYLVSFNPYFDIGYVQYSFSNSDSVANYTLPHSTCYLPCRSYVGTVSWIPKTNGRTTISLAGYEVKSVGIPASTSDYLGIDLAAGGWSSASFVINVTVYGGTEISFASFFYIGYEPNTINALISSQRLMAGRHAVGCALHMNGCGNSNSASNSTFRTASTNVVMTSPYEKQMVFYGVERMLAKWTNDASVWIGFDIDSIGFASAQLDVVVSWTGNPDLIYTLVYSVLSLQTYYCPDVPPNRYYMLNDYRCSDNCNSSIQQYANATRFCQPCDPKCYKCITTATTCTACYSDQNRIFSAASCICDVAGSFYDDGTSLICPPCNYTCKTCSGGGGGNCLTCQPIRFREISGTSCLCTVGHFDNGSATCQDCHYTCSTATCTNSSNNKCKTCNGSRFRQLLGNFTCACIAGYYDNGTNSETCARCRYSCQRCWGSNVFCTDCDNTVYRSLNLTDNTCVCDWNCQGSHVFETQISIYFKFI